jgi:hypothetical protein
VHLCAFEKQKGTIVLFGALLKVFLGGQRAHNGGFIGREVAVIMRHGIIETGIGPRNADVAMKRGNGLRPRQQPKAYGGHDVLASSNHRSMALLQTNLHCAKTGASANNDACERSINT